MQHSAVFMSFKLYSPTSNLCASSAIFVRYIQDCEGVFSFAISDVVHKPSLKSTLVNTITKTVKLPAVLCEVGNHFVMELFVRSRIYFHLKFSVGKGTRSSADADNGLDAFSSQSRSTNMVPFSVHCDFSLSM